MKDLIGAMQGSISYALFSVWHYLRHPADFLCDHGFRECDMHKQTDWYAYQRGEVDV